MPLVCGERAKNDRAESDLNRHYKTLKVLEKVKKITESVCNSRFANKKI